nr:PfkB family carbohydrate kinase [Arthrobacter zhangbolii]
MGVFAGLATLDVIHHVSAVPRANEKVTGTAQFVAAGGPAANAAVTFAGLGGRAVLLTVLGRGPVAGLIRADLGAWGVEVVDIDPERTSGAPVSSIAVTAASGERSVVSADAVSDGAEAPADLADLLIGAGTLLVDGHYPLLAVAAARAARDRGIPVVVDAGRWKSVMADLLPLADAMVCSDDFRYPGTATSAHTAGILVARGVPGVVTTHGSEPVLWWRQGEHGAVDVPAVEVRDTLGAGDVFHGAYCYFSSSSGRGIAGDLESAAGIAALRCTVPGPRAWLGLLDSPPSMP